MKKLCLALALLFVASAIEIETASAQFPFVPFGFYQPYGAEYSTSIPTPPYFAINPPVYYGSRYARPYGISPFAAPPSMATPSGYEAHPATQNYAPPVGPVAPCCIPYVSHRGAAAPVAKLTPGAIQFNPFVETVQQVAMRE